jgi:S1-C subfamily serine protease
LSAADIILEVNRKKVTTVSDLERMMAKFESGQAIILLVRERTGRRFHRPDSDASGALSEIH